MTLPAVDVSLEKAKNEDGEEEKEKNEKRMYVWLN
jgi:hypothetical protein